MESNYVSAYLFDQEEKMVGRHDKIELMAGGEYMPGDTWIPGLGEWLMDEEVEPPRLRKNELISRPNCGQSGYIDLQTRPTVFLAKAGIQPDRLLTGSPPPPSRGQALRGDDWVYRNLAHCFQEPGLQF